MLRIVGIKDLSAADQICKDGLLKAGQDPDAYPGRYDLADAFKACADRVKWVPR